MNARLHRQAASSRATPPRTKTGPELPSAFERIRQALDGYLIKAIDARKHLLAAPYDPKLLHAWRVSLRRVTATLKDVARFSDDDLHDVQTYLRACREATGQCRDVDILAQETLPAFVGKEGDKANDVDKIRQRLMEQQQQAHRQAIIALRKHSLAMPLQAWRHWTQSLEPPTDGMVRKAAAIAIERRYNTLKKRAAQLDGGQKRLHRLRSATKKLRYSVELYRHAFPKPSSAAWLKQLADLQTHLGLAHDRMMGRRLIAHVAAEDERVVKPFRQWAKRTAYDASKSAAQSLDKLDRLTHYWRRHAH